MRLSLKIIAAAVVAATSSLVRAAAAQTEAISRPPSTFVLGPNFGIESGVRSMTGLGRLLFLYDDFLSNKIELDESKAGGKVLGITGRLAKLFFVDRPLVGMQLLVTHEVFGHGSRGREAGLEPSYEFHLPAPYGFLTSHDGPLGVAFGARSGRLERDIAMTAGGIESSYWGAWWLNHDMMRNRGWIQYHDSLQYVSAKIDYVQTLGTTRSHLPTDPNDHGDADQYVSELQRRFNRWRPEDRQQIARNLRTAYFFNFVDPTFWQSIYHLLYTYAYEGKRDGKLLLAPVSKDLKLYPATRFNLSPFGAEHYLDLFANYKSWTFDLYGRGGSSGLAAYWGVGARAAGWSPGAGFTLGAELDLWTQPEMLLDARNVIERDNELGMSGALHVDWHAYGPLAVTGKLAAKSKGYLMGQPLDAGVYGYAGMSLMWDKSEAAFGE